MNRALFIVRRSVFIVRRVVVSGRPPLSGLREHRQVCPAVLNQGGTTGHASSLTSAWFLLQDFRLGRFGGAGPSKKTLFVAGVGGEAAYTGDKEHASGT